MILIPIGEKLIRSRNFRINTYPTVSDRYYYTMIKNAKGRKERVEELRRYYQAQEKAMQRSVR
jgi:hypothetical protein